MIATPPAFNANLAGHPLSHLPFGGPLPGSARRKVGFMVPESTLDELETAYLAALKCLANVGHIVAGNASRIRYGEAGAANLAEALQSPAAVPIPFIQSTAERPAQEDNWIGHRVRLAGTPSVDPLVPVALVPHVLVEVPAMRLGRHQPTVDFGRHVEVLVHGAVGELDLQDPLLPVVSHGAQCGRTDRRSLNRVLT